MSMTALVSAFARAYHTRREGAKIFDDKYARLLLSTEEHEQIGAHMASRVSFFDPAFRGDAGDALSHSALTPSMMIPPASWAISSGVSFMPPESHCSVSVRLPDTMNRQKYSSRSRSPP